MPNLEVEVHIKLEGPVLKLLEELSSNNLQLTEQVTALQERCTELLEDNRRLRRLLEACCSECGGPACPLSPDDVDAAGVLCSRCA